MALGSFNFYQWRVRRSFSPKVRRKTWKKLASQISHGIQFYQAVGILRDRARRRKQFVAEAYEHILRNNDVGGTLAQGLSGLASPEEIMLISAGEKQDPALGLNLASEMLGKKGIIRKQIIGASAYPIFLFFLVVVLLMAVSKVLVPQFSLLLPADQWVGMPALLRDIANFVTSLYGLITLFILIAFGAFLFMTLPRWTGHYRKIADNFFIWGIYREVVGSAWLYSLAVLLGAGIQIRTIFTEMINSKDSTEYIRERTKAIDRQIGYGKNLGVAMQDSGFAFPSAEVVDDMLVYAELPDLSRQIVDIAQEQMEECLENVKGKMNKLKYLLISVVAGLVLFVIQSVFAIYGQFGQSGPGAF